MRKREAKPSRRDLAAQIRAIDRRCSGASVSACDRLDDLERKVEELEALARSHAQGLHELVELAVRTVAPDPTPMRCSPGRHLPGCACVTPAPLAPTPAQTSLATLSPPPGTVDGSRFGCGCTAIAACWRHALPRGDSTARHAYQPEGSTGSLATITSEPRIPLPHHAPGFLGQWGTPSLKPGQE